MAKEPENKTWDKAKDVLIILVIPMALWCVRQEIRTSQIETIVIEQAELADDLHELEVQVASMVVPLKANTTGVDELHARIEHLTAMIEKIDRDIGTLTRPD